MYTVSSRHTHPPQAPLLSPVLVLLLPHLPRPPHALEQPLAARLDVDELFRCVDTEYGRFLGTDDDLVFDADDEVVEPFREVRQWGDVDAWLDGLRAS